MVPGYSAESFMRCGAFDGGKFTMQILSGLRAGLLAVAALFAAASVANADDGTISIRIFKAGFVIGGSAGSGVLTFQGRSYPLSIGGLSYGFTFGASETRFHGTVSNIHRPSDVNGVYAQGGAGAAVGRGAQAIVLTNQNGAVLALSGMQNGLIVSLDLSGLALSLR
jgi:lipid-binding SYLF domain-containing protein